MTNHKTNDKIESYIKGEHICENGKLTAMRVFT